MSIQNIRHIHLFKQRKQIIRFFLVAFKRQGIWQAAIPDIAIPSIIHSTVIAMICLDEGFEDAMTVMVLPRYLHKYFRTSNQIERLNKELKRRSKVIGVFPNEESLMRLMRAVLLERNEAISSVRCMFNAKTCQEMFAGDLPAKLVDIAHHQAKLLAA